MFLPISCWILTEKHGSARVQKCPPELSSSNFFSLHKLHKLFPKWTPFSTSTESSILANILVVGFVWQMDLETSSKTANIITWAGPEMELAVVTICKAIHARGKRDSSRKCSQTTKGADFPVPAKSDDCLKSGYSQVIGACVAAQP